MATPVSIVDCDGHTVESILEMAEFMEPEVRRVALNPSRTRMGVFASLEGLRYPCTYEVELVSAWTMIDETPERTGLTQDQKAAILGGNAKRFYRL